MPLFLEIPRKRQLITFLLSKQPQQPPRKRPLQLLQSRMMTKKWISLEAMMRMMLKRNE
jgi:hypothetical protein